MTAGPSYLWVKNKVVVSPKRPAELSMNEAMKITGALFFDTTPDPDNNFLPVNKWYTIYVKGFSPPWVMWERQNVQPQDVPPEFKLQLTLLGVSL